MHPLFARPTRLAIYAGMWLLAGFALAFVARWLTPRPWPDAIAFALPVSVLGGFLALSAWWVCRTRPLAPGRTVSTIVAQLVVALQTAAAGAALATAYG